MPMKRLRLGLKTWQGVGWLWVSMGLGVLEAARLILWKFGHSHFTKVDALNLFISSTVLNLSLVIGVSLIVFWTLRYRHRKKGTTLTRRHLLCAQVAIFVSLGFLIWVGRLLIVTVPVSIALLIGLYLLFLRIPARRLWVLPSGLVAGLVLLAGVGTSLLGRVPNDFGDSLEAKQLRVLPAKSSPNLILIVLDTLQAHHLSAYGYSRETSPFLSKLATEGVRFSRFYANSADTSQTMASLFTGLYPSVHGVKELGVSLPQENLTLMEILRDRGYNTSFFTTHWFIDPNYHFDQGSDYVYQAWQENGLNHAPGEHLFLWLKAGAVSPSAYQFLRTANDWKNRRLAALFGRKNMGEAKWLTEKVVAYADYITRRPDYDPEQNRFSLFVFYHDLHEPRCVHPPYDRIFDPGYAGRPLCRKLDKTDWTDEMRQNEVARYDGAIRMIDDELRRLFASLGERGLLRDTLVAVTADHGEALNEHGAYGHGGTFYQELIHIPLILWNPRRLPQGKDVSALASQVDFLPTLLEALEVPVPEEMQGQSLMPSILGTGKSRTVYGENHHGAEISQFVIDGRWKLVSRTGGRTSQKLLFDLSSDPQERKNLYEQETEVTKKMEALLEAESNRAAPKESPGGEPGED